METLFVLVLALSVALWGQAVMRALRSVSPPAQRRLKQEAERPKEARQERERILMAQIESLRPAAREWRFVEARDCQRNAVSDLGLDSKSARSHEPRPEQSHPQARARGYVYLVRSHALYKIGSNRDHDRHTTDFKAGVICSVHCSNFQEIERKLHTRYKYVRLPQTEYFRLKPNQVQEIFDLMRELADSWCSEGCVSVIDCGKIYKFGITQDLQKRMRKTNSDELLTFARCSNFKEVEQQLHARFKNVRIPRTEYFLLNSDQIRQAYGLISELAAHEAD